MRIALRICGLLLLVACLVFIFWQRSAPAPRQIWTVKSKQQYSTWLYVATDGTLLYHEQNGLVRLDPRNGTSLGKVLEGAYARIENHSGKTYLAPPGALYELREGKAVRIAELPSGDDDAYIRDVTPAGIIVERLQSLSCYDKQGKERWSLHGLSYLDKSEDGAILFAQASGSYVLGIDAASGKVLWFKRSDWNAGQGCPLASRGHVVSRLRSDGSAVWSYDAGEKITAASDTQGIWLVGEEHFFRLSLDGKLLTRRSLRGLRPDSYDQNAIILTGRDRHYPGMSGGPASPNTTKPQKVKPDVYIAYSPAGKLLWRLSTDKLGWGHVQCSGKYIYLNADSELIAYEVPRRGRWF